MDSKTSRREPRREAQPHQRCGGSVAVSSIPGLWQGRGPSLRPSQAALTPAVSPGLGGWGRVLQAVGTQVC